MELQNNVLFLVVFVSHFYCALTFHFDGARVNPFATSGMNVNPRDFKQDIVMTGHVNFLPNTNATFRQDGKLLSFTLFNVNSQVVRFQIWRKVESRIYRLIWKSDTFDVAIPESPGITSEFVLDPYININSGDIFGLEFYETCPVMYLSSTNSACDDTMNLQYKVPDPDDGLQSESGGNVYRGVSVGDKVQFIPLTNLGSNVPYCRQYALMANVMYNSMYQNLPQCSVLEGDDESKRLSSPGFTDGSTTQPYEDACWTLIAPEDKLLRLDITEFSMVDQYCRDFMQIFEGDVPIKSPQLTERLCNDSAKDRTIVSSGNTVTVYLHYWNTGCCVDGQGFTLKYKVVPEGYSLSDEDYTININVFAIVGIAIACCVLGVLITLLAVLLIKKCSSKCSTTRIGATEDPTETAPVTRETQHENGMGAGGATEKQEEAKPDKVLEEIMRTHGLLHSGEENEVQGKKKKNKKGKSKKHVHFDSKEDKRVRYEPEVDEEKRVRYDPQTGDGEQDVTE